MISSSRARPGSSSGSASNPAARRRAAHGRVVRTRGLSEEAVRATAHRAPRRGLGLRAMRRTSSPAGTRRTPVPRSAPRSWRAARGRVAAQRRVVPVALAAGRPAASQPRRRRFGARAPAPPPSPVGASSACRALARPARSTAASPGARSPRPTPRSGFRARRPRRRAQGRRRAPGRRRCRLPRARGRARPRRRPPARAARRDLARDVSSGLAALGHDAVGAERGRSRASAAVATVCSTWVRPPDRRDVRRRVAPEEAQHGHAALEAGLDPLALIPVQHEVDRERPVGRRADAGDRVTQLLGLEPRARQHAEPAGVADGYDELDRRPPTRSGPARSQPAADEIAERRAEARHRLPRYRQPHGARRSARRGPRSRSPRAGTPRRRTRRPAVRARPVRALQRSRARLRAPAPVGRYARSISSSCSGWIADAPEEAERAARARTIAPAPRRRAGAGRPTAAAAADPRPRRRGPSGCARSRAPRPRSAARCAGRPRRARHPRRAGSPRRSRARPRRRARTRSGSAARACCRPARALDHGRDVLRPTRPSARAPSRRPASAPPPSSRRATRESRRR